MEKIVCTECGAELRDSVKFCTKCGAPVENNISPNSNEEDNKNSSNNEVLKIKRPSNKTKNTKFSINAKNLGIIGILIIILILGIVLIGTTVINPSNDANLNNNTSEPITQLNIENIYGINFSIPNDFKNVKSKDYESDGNGVISCTRTYENPNGTEFSIIVATTEGSWTLDNVYNSVNMTINGHEGKYEKLDNIYSCISGNKLVVISGASQEELESIIIE